MLKKSKQRLLFIIGLFISFYLEGTLMHVFPFILAGKFPMVPYLTITWLIYTVLFSDPNQNLHLYWWAFGIGLLYDSYYIGVLGIYTVIFPVVILVTKLILEYVDENIYGSTMIYLIDIIIVLVLGYIGGRMSHLVYFSGVHFFAYAFGPTLLLNLVIFLLLYFPISLLFDKYRQ
ncbi:rod shape-determining protein MreD [Fructilactobacillus sp. Tb1]|uniref:rod shape-determining protein MreD n=1 Tax=Fructilactobacillus sp. Tb1 TaxID=3422304 RepID=UPI003D278143